MFAHTRIFSTAIVCFLLCGMTASADGMPNLTVYGYNGYISVPSAYIDDGQFGIHYSVLPASAAPFHTDDSDNQVFTANVGLFPFLECHLSVYAAPSIRWIYNTGSDKTRSAGFKVKVLDEKRIMPAVAIGIHDPQLDDIGATTYQQISSSFCVLSKQFAGDRVTVSTGYGFDLFDGTYKRLNGVFFGFSCLLVDHVTCMADYSDNTLYTGIGVEILPVNLALMYVGESALAYRVSYRINLL